MKDFLRLVRPYFSSSHRKYAFGMGLLLIIMAQSLVVFGYWFVQWNGRFYDALGAKNFALFIHEALVFCGLALCYVLVYALYRYYGQHYALRWRLWMTNQALMRWLSIVQRGELEGADQRIQEDLMRFTTIVERFLLEGFNSIVLIIFFTPMLFNLTAGLVITEGFSVSWCLFLGVIAYTVLGMFISIKIAKPLINLEYKLQKYEAKLRYDLVHARDGKQFEPENFSSVLATITSNYGNMYAKQKQFNIWQKAYDQFSFLIPFIALGPSYFGGIVGLGALMQIRSTFSRIRNAMAYLLDHYTEFTELLAICKRLSEFFNYVDKFKMLPTTCAPSCTMNH